MIGVAAAIVASTPHVPGLVAGAVTSATLPLLLAGGNTRDSRMGSVWVVNRDRGELAVFDAETGTVLTTLPVGAGAHDICISEEA